MAQTAKLKVVKIQRHEQTFGAGTTPYATFLCETDAKEYIPVGLSHNMLKSAGISSALFEDLCGSTLIIGDDADLRTGEIRRVAMERIQAVVEKRPKSSILLVNSTNAELIKSETFRDASFEYQSRVDSNVKVVEERERRLQRARLRAQQLEQDLTTETASTPDADESLASSTPASDAEIAESTQAVADALASLEKNEEMPF